MPGKRSAAPRPRSPERFPGRPGRVVPSLRPPRPRHKSVFHWVAYEALRRAELRRARFGADAPDPATPGPAPGAPPAATPKPGPVENYGLSNDQARKYIGWYKALLQSDKARSDIQPLRMAVVRVWNKLLALQEYPVPRELSNEELTSSVEEFDKTITQLYGSKLLGLIVTWTSWINSNIKLDEQKIEYDFPNWKDFPLGGSGLTKDTRTERERKSPPGPAPQPEPTPTPKPGPPPGPPPSPAPPETPWYWWLLGVGVAGALGYVLFAPVVRDYLGQQRPREAE